MRRLTAALAMSTVIAPIILIILTALACPINLKAVDDALHNCCSRRGNSITTQWLGISGEAALTGLASASAAQMVRMIKMIGAITVDMASAGVRRLMAAPRTDQPWRPQ